MKLLDKLQNLTHIEKAALKLDTINTTESVINWASTLGIIPTEDNSWQDTLYSCAYYGQLSWEKVAEILEYGNKQVLFDAAAPTLARLNVSAEIIQQYRSGQLELT